MAVRRYFLGANTARGFFSVYEDFCRRCAARLRRDFPDEAERIARVPVLGVFFERIAAT